MELITTLPSKERFHALIRSLIIAGDVVVVRQRGTRGIGGAGVLELIQDDLGDGLAHGNACRAELALAKVVAPCVVMVILDLAFLLGEVASVALAGEIVAVGMTAASPIRASVWHVVAEEAVMAGNSTPTRGQDWAEVMGCLAVCGKMVVPGAVGAMLSLLKLFLGQGIVGGILAVPGDRTMRSTPQSWIGPCDYVGLVRHSVASTPVVLPCQFTSLFILVH
jgi:hypothetical protein